MGERRPRSVFGVGEEPDPRFSLANERTFLAWIRTALALLGIAVAADLLLEGPPAWVTTVVSVALSLMSALACLAAWSQWRRSELAMRTGRPLPAPRTAVLAIGVGVVATLVVVALLWP